MTKDIVKVFHCCDAEKHKQCVEKDEADITTVPDPGAQLTFELNPPDDATYANDGKVKWSEAMKWPYIQTAK